MLFVTKAEKNFKNFIYMVFFRFVNFRKIIMMEHQIILSLIINTEFLKSNLCDYNNVYFLVRGNFAIIRYQVT